METKYQVIKNGFGIDGKVRKIGEIVTGDMIGDNVQRFVELGILKAIDEAAAPVPAAHEDREADAVHD